MFMGDLMPVFICLSYQPVLVDGFHQDRNGFPITLRFTSTGITFGWLKLIQWNITVINSGGNR